MECTLYSTYSRIDLQTLFSPVDQFQDKQIFFKYVLTVPKVARERGVKVLLTVMLVGLRRIFKKDVLTVPKVAKERGVTVLLTVMLVGFRQ